MYIYGIYIIYMQYIYIYYVLTHIYIYVSCITNIHVINYGFDLSQLRQRHLCSICNANVYLFQFDVVEMLAHPNQVLPFKPVQTNGRVSFTNESIRSGWCLQIGNSQNMVGGFNSLEQYWQVGTRFATRGSWHRYERSVRTQRT